MLRVGLFSQEWTYSMNGELNSSFPTYQSGKVDIYKPYSVYTIINGSPSRLLRPPKPCGTSWNDYCVDCFGGA